MATVSVAIPSTKKVSGCCLQLTCAGLFIWIQGKSFQAAAKVGAISIHTLVFASVVFCGTVVHSCTDKNAGFKQKHTLG